MTDHVLTLNAGSSSLKIGLFTAAAEPEVRATGAVERIGGAAALTLEDAAGATLGTRDLGEGGADHAGALDAALAMLREHFPEAGIAAVGHRVVHGGQDHDAPVRLDDAVLARLAELEPFAPLHQPHNLAGVRAARAAFPEAVQVACFDTAFHRHHPFVNDVFGLPRELYERGVRRYGFHGLSYDYIAGELARAHPALHAGRVAVAHLGNGASICGMVQGRSVASTMGFTALDGLPMGTRVGQLDPGVVLHLIEQEGMSAAEVTGMLYKRSGLLGLSGISNDMRTLEASDDPRADEAIAYFTFRIRREIGAMAAAMEGLDGIVFTGGIGENSARVRREVCAPMSWLGVALDAAANEAGAARIDAGGDVGVLVIPTDEERVIARAAAAALG
ncbi:acetate/propionate family kinase [Rhodosalinus sediminis]|uniref:acetate/propionate family kinase n=1 Tax=Rhodosalinus sediminis TaxID=1940533 RepID=UPI0023528702|nr:acetate/propionate family kinase [Rhodosalinus sediminis]